MEELFKALFSNYTGKSIFKINHSFCLLVVSTHTWLSCFASSAEQQLLTAVTLLCAATAVTEEATRRVQTLEILCRSGAAAEQAPIWVSHTTRVTERSRQRVKI